MKRIALWIPVLALALAGCGRGAQPVPGETPPPSELSASMEGADDQGMIDPGGTLVVRFSEPMSPTSARPPVTASPRVALRTSWSGDYRSLTIGPQQYFKPGEEIVNGNKLFWEQVGYKAGGRPVKVIVADTACIPDNTMAQCI